MANISLLPFEHPTTVVLVDDEQDYLRGLSIALGRNFNVRSFTNPEPARAAFAAQGGLFAEINHPEQVPRLTDRTRFDLLSVLVTDYEMGTSNGVDLCRRLENRAIGRILLTGKVDERFAVRAFNEDIIDRYVRKDDPQFIELTRQFIAGLQQDYFQRSAASHDDPRYLEKAGYLFDPVFAKYFRESRLDNSIIESYLNFDLPGFYMADGDGDLLLFLVLTESRIAEHIERAENHNAPRELVDLLRAGRVIPCFPDRDSHYSPIYATTWRNWTVASKILDGRKRYYHAVVSGTPAQAAFLGAEIYPYNRYLQTLRH